MVFAWSTIDWKCSKFYTTKIRNGETRKVKYVYIVIMIMNDVLWKGREGVSALSSRLI